MTAQHLDRVLGATKAVLKSAEDVSVFETTPYEERIGAQSTYEALQIGASQNPDAPALQFLSSGDPDTPPLTVSYARFIARVTQAANLFNDLGVGPNDVVSLLMPLVPQSFFSLFGAQAAGIANPVNPLLSPAQITEILRAANTRVLVALGPVPGTDIWDKVQRIKGDLPNLKAIVVVHGAADPANGVYSFDEKIDAYPSDRLVSGRRIASDETAAYFHTGGTTGTPKLVRHTHRNQVYQAWGVNLMLSMGRGRSLLFGLPLFHVGGALTQALAPLAGGGTLVVVSAAGWRDANAIRNVWRLVERYKPEVFGSVPTVLAASINVPVGGADLSSIVCASGGGSAIPVAVGKAYMEMLKKPVLEVYGMTETSSIHTMSYMDRPLRLGSVGHALPYSRVRIVKIDADGRYAGDCATNEIGVVAMAGPGVFSGYLDPSHQKGAFVEPGWVNSGDLGRLDEDGYLWLTGRAKDLIIRGGHNIDPLAIEEVFFQHPDVALAAVVGQPDAYAGELPVAFVQLKPGAKADDGALLDFVRERTPERAAVPVAVIFVDAIPLTAVGKVFKPALRLSAAQRAVSIMLADVLKDTVSRVEVVAHPVHGHLIKIRVGGVPGDSQEALAAQVHERLNPLEMQHEIEWD
ncbi:acyl-CoA synthetase [Variovorax sp. J22R133]|uniref:acyl-CoA synthetase n=1 Tax=Variovorax brevis TaxID=3053503 RepID=UPI0025777EBB|nr:acyl-CoA synthetase [Variovorax sp. J22R133]MDM0113063.1 acyl-CoA synthetase [Variovorax sp. J22R133]